MKLTHRQIDVFRAVVRAGQVTGAAQALHTSQPTVSRDIARLEQVLGITLFDRVRGRLRPTAAALVLMDEVERAHAGFERVSSVAASLKDLGDGRLAVACLPALGHALLPDVLRRVAIRHPRVRVSITPLDSPMLEQALSEQRFDLGLIEHLRAPAGTQSEGVLDAWEVAVLPAGDPLLDKSHLTLQDFAGRRFVSLDPQDSYRQQIDTLFTEAGVSRELTVETASAVSVCECVKQGLGLAIVNPLTALAMGSAQLHVRPLSVAIPFQLALVQPDLRPGSGLQADFSHALREALAALAPLLQACAPLSQAVTNRPFVSM